MQRLVAFLLLSVLMLSNLVATQDSSVKPTQCVVSYELIAKIVTQVRQEMIDCKADNALASQLMILSKDVATIEIQRKLELQTTRDELQKVKADQKLTADDLQVTKSEVELLRSRESNPGSSSFVHWGRKSCPGNTTLVYSGVAGGKHHNEKGSGTNRLCLSRQPEFDNNITSTYWGHLFGAEYEHIMGLHNQDVPCSVCLAPESTTIMVPGTRTCPPTWTPQYHGHLASQWHAHFASDYACLDHEPEADTSSLVDHNGLLFYYTKAKCGSLPCPPYINDKVVTCVVCSK